jgi:hypothetical protein
VNDVILDLCGGTGGWSKPYVDAGYNVIIVDPLAEGPSAVRQDVRTFKPAGPVHGILAAPPCTQFASSGARWWKGKPAELLSEGLSVVAGCLRVIAEAGVEWWALENPVGRLPKLIGAYRYTFQPYEYGDPWAKRTCIWGPHTQPTKNPVARDPKQDPWRLPPSEDRWRLRSKTPAGFAKCFFEANP